MWKRLQNQQLQKRLTIRSRIISLIREFFVKEEFLEVETPILVPYAGQEPYLEPMRVSFLDNKHQTRDGYLITSPEYSHKKLLAAGFEKTFEITKCFRGGEPVGGLHNLEFTMIEWYHAGVDYTETMKEVEAMVFYVASRLQNQPTPANSKFNPPVGGQNSKLQPKTQQLFIGYQGRKIDLTFPWQRLSMQEAWEKYVSVKKHAKIYDRRFLRELCEKRGYTVSENDTYDDLFFKIFLIEIEPKLGFDKPVILYDYPPQMAALARLKSSSGSPFQKGGVKGDFLAERFEVYIAGLELANAFSELNDAREQKKRFLEEQKLRRKLGKEIVPLDEDFLDAVGQMSPSAGIAFGIDRLVMLLTNTARIEDVLAFPQSDQFPKT